MNAEKGIIGQLLLSPEYIQLLTLTAEEFTCFECRKIFQAMKQLEKQDMEIDVVSLNEILKDENLVNFIKNIIIENPLPSEKLLNDYEKIVKEKSLKAKIERQTRKIQSMLENSPYDDIQAEIEKLSKYTNHSSGNNELTARDGVMNFYNDLSKKKQYVSTGVNKLDKLLFIDKGDYIVIGGRPSAGKTAFALELASCMAKKLNVVFFSLETSNSKIYDRLMVRNSGVQFNKIKTREFKNDDKDKIVEAIGTVGKLNFTSVECAGYNVGQIKAKALKLKADVIFIDYLGLIKSEGNSRYEKVTNISVDLHTMAQSLGITVIALSQLNRDGKGKPTMEDLRDSGQVEQDADAILLLHNIGESNDYHVIVAKNKEGEQGYIPFKFYGETQRFCEIEYLGGNYVK